MAKRMIDVQNGVSGAINGKELITTPPAMPETTTEEKE